MNKQTLIEHLQLLKDRADRQYADENDKAHNIKDNIDDYDNEDGAIDKAIAQHQNNTYLHSGMSVAYSKAILLVQQLDGE